MGKLQDIKKKIYKKIAGGIYYYSALGKLNFISDKTLMKILWKLKIGTKLDLKNPKGFNEKLQWLKLYDHRDIYTKIVDKVLVRDFVKDIIGEEYLVELLGVWDSADDIDFDELPNEFVLKCNHNSGGAMCVCDDKSKLDIDKVRAKLNDSLKINYYDKGREWPYKNVKPKILCEKLLVDHDPNNTSDTLIDYKFHCFNGKPLFLYACVDGVANGEKGDSKLSFYDLEWKPAPFYRSDHLPLPFDAKKPEKFDEMVEIAKKLSAGFPFVRIDLYYVDGKIYFSEMTLFPGAGFGLFSPEEWERKLGDEIILPDKTE